MNLRSEIILKAHEEEIINNRRLDKDLEIQFQRTAGYIIRTISNLNNYYNIDDLIKLQCFFPNPDYNLFAILNKYQISIHGIFEGDKTINFVSDKEKINEIINKLEELIY